MRSIDELEIEISEAFPATATQTIENIRKWSSGRLPLIPTDTLDSMLREAPVELIHESFWRWIPFGTGGVRGTVGLGPNRINSTVVGLTIQAHCDFLRRLQHEGEVGESQNSIVVANDVRFFADHARNYSFLQTNPLLAVGAAGVSSRSMAHLAAEIYGANGFQVYMMEPGNHSLGVVLTTPELSFLIRNLDCAAGINMSASHNPPDDNGIKVYDQNGGQYLPPRDEELTEYTQSVTAVVQGDLAELVARGTVAPVPPEAIEEYRALYLDRARNRAQDSRARTKILFTPLAGCGSRTVGLALEELGFAVSEPESEQPDGSFASIPLAAPNPEVEQSTEGSKKAASAAGAELVLAADPDADRLGAEVAHGDDWVHLTGNQIATTIAYWLLLDGEGPRLRGAVYQTIVTTLAVRQIAERAGITHIVDDLLVGFKYIGEAIKAYEDSFDGNASDEDLISFAAEESHGFLDTPHLRDKDAMAGALHLAALHERLRLQGRTLIDYLQDIYATIGFIGDRGRSISVLGSAGVATIQRTMAFMRKNPPQTIGGHAVRRFSDYRDESVRGAVRSGTDWAARDILVLELDFGRLTLRPSGTEPKLKFYLQTTPAGGGPASQEEVDDVATQVYTDVLSIMGYTLDPVFASLPDVIAIDNKLALQNEVLPELEQRLAESPETAVSWLDARVSKLVPGQSALSTVLPAFAQALGPAASRPLAECKELRKDVE